MPGLSMESEDRLLKITLLQLTNIAMVIGWETEPTNHLGWHLGYLLAEGSSLLDFFPWLHGILQLGSFHGFGLGG